MSHPCVSPSAGLGEGVDLSSFLTTCFARVLYMPRCLPEGDVVVLSGHF